MARQLSALLLLLLLCLWVRPALAQTVGGSCSISGQTVFTSVGVLACNGSIWELAEQWSDASTEGVTYQNFGNDVGSCTTAKTGELIYTGSTWKYCDGGNWDAFPPTASVTAISQSSNDVCGIASGLLYCWGSNQYGEVGNNNPTQSYYAPQQIGLAANWTAVSTGGLDTCGIAGGALYCWGENGYGELGLGNTTEYNTPQQVGSDTTWTAISIGRYSTCGVDNGKLYCWGYNYYGNLGLGNTSNYSSPQQVGSATNWTAVSSGSNDTCGIAGGSLYCWGLCNMGECGLGNTTQYLTPQRVGSLVTWTAISQFSFNESDTCGIAGGAMYCWGQNTYGAVGVGNTTQYTSPQQVGSDTTWTAVSAGGDDTCGIDNGKLYCWGQNRYGELGVGNQTEYNTPQQVGSATNWIAVSNGQFNTSFYKDTCAVTSTAAYCWGFGNNGVIGNGTLLTEYNTPVLTGPVM